MGKKSTPSMVRQVEMALKSLQCYGQSKHEEKQNRRGEYLKGIYSYKTMETYLKSCCSFAKWAKAEYGSKRLVDLNSNMVEKYIEKLTAEGKSAWTLQTVRSSFKKLERGIEKRFGKQVELIPSTLVIPKRLKVNRINRGAYQPQEVRGIFEYLKDNSPVNLIVSIQYSMGLRIHEVLKISSKDIDFQGSLLTVKGKGGRVRVVPIPSNVLHRLKKLIENKDGGNNSPLINISERTVQLQVQKACLSLGISNRGTHGFRHSYALSQYCQLRQAGMQDQDARMSVSSLIGHSRLDVTYFYIPKEISLLSSEECGELFVAYQSSF